ncbi:diguanylate phosphodiesterase [Stenomitos frigidus ULC18]|uniref:histidine kinase n=2 Tax=Stenomitos TaxID=1844270 RepID=A0A2T1E3E1_9CYAN|nr:diguanylate phosphodiesterase [Stenomitos frigidus ULC18]
MAEDPNQCSVGRPYSMSLLGNTALSICHELRTPLTSIQGALGLLHTGQLGCLSDEGQRVLAIAINNVNRLTRLANAMEDQPLLPMTLLAEGNIEQLQLENALYGALDRQEFQLAYQSIVSVDNNSIIGFEALARWYHPSKGVISPDIFIALAEKNQCIHPLGLWILEQACRQLYTWQQQFSAHPSLTMSVNLSALQLLQPNLVQEVQQILEKTQVRPSSLKLEITESMLIENQQEAIFALSQLRDMGIQLYVDDFGTGYSSLGRLQDLPIDVLKIDRSFVQSQQWDISETIVLLAAKLGLDVIAEGVETAEDQAALEAVGCTKMQGYHFSKPLNSQAATALITASHYS